MVASPVPSRGPKSGWNCDATTTFLGVPNTKCREEIRSGCLTPVFSGAQKSAELLCNPCMRGGSQRQVRGGNQKWLRHPSLPSPGPNKGPNSYVTPAVTGVPIAKRGEEIRSGCLTPAFSGAQKKSGIAT